jgi:hypothetical protein
LCIVLKKREQYIYIVYINTAALYQGITLIV